jgi:cell division protein FtsI/penicillin-binding protein 2
MRKSRVLMAAAGLFLGLAGLWIRVAWLQIVEHAHYEARAERNQEQRVLVPPVRGNLLDRHGKPLARDLLTCSISAAPREMTDPGHTARDLARVLDMDAQKLARAFTARPRFLWVARRVSPTLGEEISGWKRRGVFVSIERRRDYPLGNAAAEVLGRTNVDNVGVEGLELQFDDQLRGAAGWETLFRDGRGRTLQLERGLKRSPENGRHVVLTIDSDLQAILESHLARAADTLHAMRAFGLFLDPQTGEILAAANVPHLAEGRARNWIVTDQFEPGSTFKIVVAGASLEEGTARPDQWFEASESGQALMAPGAIFHDVHKAAGYTFRDAVRWSSNIVMGHLGILLGPQRLYRYAVNLGFGGITGLEFPGEASGRLRTPEHWSARSCPTIAIGHELSVTPLQLALAYAAVANGGVLMQPMLVREIRDDDGNVVRRYTPRAARRVFSPTTTRLLNGMLEMVVDSGTAKAARVPGLEIAGKTGTAQKYDAAARTYGRGMYVSSFAGYAPAEEPSLVGVIVIDEPRGKHYYGGEVAAPVFREVMLDLRRLPHGPLAPDITQIAARPPSPAPVMVPDVRLLPPRAAEERLEDVELRAHVVGTGARVLAQQPAAGEQVERGASVTVWLAAPADSTPALPDLAGVPVREALRRLTALEVPARIHGQGVVQRQLPVAGTPLPIAGACELWCVPGLVTSPAADARAESGERGSGLGLERNEGR